MTLEQRRKGISVLWWNIWNKIQSHHKIGGGGVWEGRGEITQYSLKNEQRFVIHCDCEDTHSNLQLISLMSTHQMQLKPILVLQHPLAICHCCIPTTQVRYKSNLRRTMNPLATRPSTAGAGESVGRDWMLIYERHAYNYNIFI